LADNELVPEAATWLCSVVGVVASDEVEEQRVAPVNPGSADQHNR
jgi:hypothetical protein